MAGALRITGFRENLVQGSALPVHCLRALWSSLGLGA
jgi:hypothetical protein